MQHYQINPTTLELQVVKIRRNYYSLLVLGIVLMLLGFTSGVEVKTVIERVPILLQLKEQECTPQSVKEFIIKMNLKFPKIVYQQVICESANLQSPTFKQFNNLFGMEKATVRPTLGKDVGARWAKYDDWKQSIIDYALWQTSYTGKIDSEEDYYIFLDEVYCSYKLKENAGEHYSTRLKRIPYDN